MDGGQSMEVQEKIDDGLESVTVWVIEILLHRDDDAKERVKELGEE